MILCTLVLVVGFTLLGQAASTRPSIRNDSRDFISSPVYDRMSTFLHSVDVYHMEPDLYVDGNIFFSDMCSLKTTDGTTTTTIAGHRNICNFYNGVGILARFQQIHGFRQISPTEVVIVDLGNHCLRLLDRITLHTSVYAGSCGNPGYADGSSSAKFSSPIKMIDDFKQPGMLIVTDFVNHALRNVNKISVSNVHLVSTFIRSTSNLLFPRGLAQNPITGDIFITGNNVILKLTYSTKSISILSGERNSRGTRDCDFEYSRFFGPQSIILIGQNKLLLADIHNSNFRLMDLGTRTVTSLCTGKLGFSDGDMTTCDLRTPYSLMVVNATLYIGQYRRIRRIQDSRITACSEQEIRRVASAETGVASVDIPLLAGMFKLHLAPGTYPAEITSEKANCTINIRVLDALVKRRLVMESHYNVKCDSATKRDLLDFQALKQFVDVTYRQLEDVCQPDCSRAQIDVLLTCEVNILTVIWPTNIVYDGGVVAIPQDLEERLNMKIEAKGAAFYLYIQGHTPPFVYPNQEDNRGYVIPSIYSYCENEGYVYNKQKDICEKRLS